MKRFFIFLFILFLFSSCEVFKHTLKTNKTTNKNTNRKIHQVRYKYRVLPKDTTIFIPNILYKDTTIIKKGKTTTLILDYNKIGNVKKAKCISKGVKEISKTVSETEEKINEQTKENTKEKVKTVKTDYQPYILGLIVLILIFLIIDKIKK